MSAKIKFGSDLYLRLATEEYVYAVDLTPCNDCGAPVREGYCCPRCGSPRPESDYDPEDTRNLFL
jgi:hypothetical protein